MLNRPKKRDKNITKIKDISNKTPGQLKKYFQRDRENNFICMRALEDSAREFLKMKVTRFQSSFNFTSLFALFFTIIALMVSVTKLGLDFIYTATLIHWGAAILFLAVLLMKANFDSSDLETLCEEYELTYLK